MLRTTGIKKDSRQKYLKINYLIKMFLKFKKNWNWFKKLYGSDGRCCWRCQRGVWRISVRKQMMQWIIFYASINIWIYGILWIKQFIKILKRNIAICLKTIWPLNSEIEIKISMASKFRWLRQIVDFKLLIKHNY